MLNKTVENDATIVKFPARLDTKVVADFEDDLKNTIEESQNLVYDMTGVNYVSSMFIRFCLAANKAKNIASFSVVNVDPKVKLVFKISGLDSMIKED